MNTKAGVGVLFYTVMGMGYEVVAGGSFLSLVAQQQQHCSKMRSHFCISFTSPQESRNIYFHLRRTTASSVSICGICTVSIIIPILCCSLVSN